MIEAAQSPWQALPLASADERDVLAVAATALAQLYPGIGYIRVLMVSQNYSPSHLLELCAQQRMAAVMAEVSSITSSSITSSSVTGSNVTGSNVNGSRVNGSNNTGGTSGQGIDSSAIGSSGAAGSSGDSSSRHGTTADASSAPGSSGIGSNNHNISSSSSRRQGSTAVVSSAPGSSNSGSGNIKSNAVVGSSRSTARECRFTCSQQAAMRQGVPVFTPQLAMHTDAQQQHTDPEQQHSFSEQYLDWHALHQEFGLCSFASVPLMVGGTVHGVMLAAAGLPHAFTASSMHLICTVAHILAPYAAVMYKHQQIQSTRALLEQMLPPRVVAAAIERLSFGGNSLVDLFVPTHHSFAPQG